eukprot:6224342-Amphidinium_carterae.1
MAPRGIRGAGVRGLASCLMLPAAAMWDSGTLPVGSTWGQWVSKFCYDYNVAEGQAAGGMQVYVSGARQGNLVTPIPAEQREVALCGPMAGDSFPQHPCEVDGQLYLAIYDDEEDHWERVVSDFWDLPCLDKLRAASFFVPVRPENGMWNWTEKITERVRPRFWYFTFVACKAPVTTELHYEIHAYNIRHGPLDVQQEFSIDKKGTLHLQ